jgi:hypothetical protein
MISVEVFGASLSGLTTKTFFQRPFHQTIREEVLPPPDASECNIQEMRIESSANLTDQRSIATADSAGSNHQDIERLISNVLANIK